MKKSPFQRRLARILVMALLVTTIISLSIAYGSLPAMAGDSGNDLNWSNASTDEVDSERDPGENPSGDGGDSFGGDPGENSSGDGGDDTDGSTGGNSSGEGTGSFPPDEEPDITPDNQSPSYIPPTISSPEGPQTISVRRGEKATLSVVCTDAADYCWFIDRNDGKGFVAIEGANSASYTTSEVSSVCDGYRYYCCAYNGSAGILTPFFTLDVY